MICMAMYGNGVQIIGMIIIKVYQRMGVPGLMKKKMILMTK